MHWAPHMCNQGETQSVTQSQRFSLQWCWLWWGYRTELVAFVSESVACEETSCPRWNRLKNKLALSLCHVFCVFDAHDQSKTSLRSNEADWKFLKVISMYLWFCVFVQSPRQFAQLLREKATQTRQSEAIPPCLFPPCLSWTSTLLCKGVFLPLVLLRNQSVTFCCHQASYGNKTEADVSDWCCCWSSFSFYQSWRTKNHADGVSERKWCFCFTAVWLCQVGTLPWTVCNGTMTPRPCRPSCQLEASDTSFHSNVVVFHGLFPRQSFGSLLSAVCWKSTWPPLEVVWEFLQHFADILHLSLKLNVVLIDCAHRRPLQSLPRINPSNVK